MVNGYVTLDLASNNIYKESLGAIKSGKPVMVVDAPNVYFADTIATATIDDDVVVVITKGGKTITITDVNAVSSEGDIQNHLWCHNITIEFEDDNNETINASIVLTTNKESYTINDFIDSDYIFILGTNGDNLHGFCRIEQLGEDGITLNINLGSNTIDKATSSTIKFDDTKTQIF